MLRWERGGLIAFARAKAMTPVSSLLDIWTEGRILHLTEEGDESQEDTFRAIPLLPYATSNAQKRSERREEQRLYDTHCSD